MADSKNKDLEKLKQNFPNCFGKNGEFDFEKFKTQLSKNEINFSKESYTMDWLGKSYARLLATDEATTLLKEDESHNQQPENKTSENLLIKGDNLEVLKHLANAYYEKVKMIYIDPPYNTGSDGFVYADDRKFTVAELQELAGISEERAKRILAFTKSKSNSHSAWLTFMYPRLYIAKQLLKDDGVIFVSIDDNEVAQLRILMDEIFGEDNFLGDIIWNKKNVVQNDAKFTSINHEYLITYRKSIGLERFELLVRSENANNRYKNPDNDPKGRWTSVALTAKSGSDSNNYEITFSNGVNWKPTEGTYPRLSKDSLLKAYDDGKIWFGENGNNVPRLKKYLSEVKSGIISNSIWLNEEVGSTQSAKERVKKLLNNNVFDTPKPVGLISKCINLILKKESNEIVFDFFAGSGTTADAVMQLNAEDGGNRKFILAQLPELIDKKKNKTAYDFVQQLKTQNSKLKTNESPSIFDITKERLIRAAKKINTELDQKTKNLELKIQNFQAELQTEATQTEIKNLQQQITQNSKLKTQNYFKVFETMPIWDDYNFEADKLIPEQVGDQELFDPKKLEPEDIKALLTTWQVNDGIALTQSLQPIALNNYTGYYAANTLYLMARDFDSNCLKVLLEKIDSDSSFNPATIIIFGYHFESSKQREIAENIKSYSNKKHIDIDLIVRYKL